MTRRGSANRLAFGWTLLELLVVLALLAVLIAMLIPAVHRVRETAARVDCANHLKQIGLAFQTHESARGHYPPGGSHLPPPLGRHRHCAPSTRRDLWSWGYHLLPFLNEAELHKNPDARTIFRQPIKAYYCPARRPAELFEGEAKIDYAGNAGTDANGRNGVVLRTGFGLCTSRDVVDGVAYTIAVAEKQLNVAMLGQSEGDGRSYVTAGWNGNMVVYRFGTLSPDRDFAVPGCKLPPSERFGSSHRSGFNAVFCDGSVRHIRYSVDPLRFRAACVRDDGTNYNPNDF